MIFWCFTKLKSNQNEFWSWPKKIYWEIVKLNFCKNVPPPTFCSCQYFACYSNLHNRNWMDLYWTLHFILHLLIYHNPLTNIILYVNTNFNITIECYTGIHSMHMYTMFFYHLYSIGMKQVLTINYLNVDSEIYSIHLGLKFVMFRFFNLS